MLVPFLRSLRYIFSYFSRLKNECASECMQQSFSARHFPSIVDEWLNAPHHLCHTLMPPFHDKAPSTSIRWPIRPSVQQSIQCWSSDRGSFSPKGRAWGCSLMRTSAGWVFPTQGAPHLIYRSTCQRHHHQMAIQWTTTMIHDHQPPLGDYPPPVPQPMNNNRPQVPTTHTWRRGTTSIHHYHHHLNANYHSLQTKMGHEYPPATLPLSVMCQPNDERREQRHCRRSSFMFILSWWTPCPSSHTTSLTTTTPRHASTSPPYSDHIATTPRQSNTIVKMTMDDDHDQQTPPSLNPLLTPIPGATLLTTTCQPDNERRERRLLSFSSTSS